MPPLLALFSWPLVVLALARKLTPAPAFIVAILAGFLFLPPTISYDLPLLPALTKDSIPALSVLLLLALFRPGLGGDRERPLLPQSRFIWIATIGLAAGALATVLTNGDPLFYGPTVLPGMRLYDGLSQILSAIILLLPMLLARKFLAYPETHVLLLKVLCIAGLGYSLLALVEVRMSPQLNQWVYGFFPHSFVQHYRSGGWRPIVFLSHGLVVSLFFCMTTLAAAGLSRLDGQKRSTFLAATVWLLLTLVLTKSLGALTIAILMLPAALLWGVRGQLITACVVATLVMSYPIARSSGIIPVQQITQMAETINPDRASSFRLRVENEDRILAKAQQRPLFGWGIWGRSRVFDLATGIDITVADGLWAGVMSSNGWLGYLLEFGLLCLPIILLFRRHRHYEIGMESSILALLLAANLIDLLPNSGLTPVTWMIAGALWGRLELGRIEAGAKTGAVMGSNNVNTGYSQSSALRDKVDVHSPSPSQYTRQRSRHDRRQNQET